MKAFVDQHTCIGCGLCPSISPDIFEMDDSGKARAIKEDVPDDLRNEAQEAEESCPVDAIKVE